MLQNEFAVFQHKIHLVEALGAIFRKPEYLIDLYYNYDNNDSSDWAVCGTMMRVLSDLCDENLDTPVKRTLVLTTLKVMRKFVEMIAKRLKVSGMKENDSILDLEDTTTTLEHVNSSRTEISVHENSMNVPQHYNEDSVSANR
eukprot:UN05331